MGLVETLTSVKDRLEDNRASLEQFCSDNGIEVGDTDISALIEAIKAESGSGVTVISGEVTPAADTDCITVESGNVKTEPLVAFLIAKNQDDLLGDAVNVTSTFCMGGQLVKACNTGHKDYLAYRSGYNANTKSFYFKATSAYVAYYREMYLEVQFNSNSSRKWKAGQTYSWVIIF